MLSRRPACRLPALPLIAIHPQALPAAEISEVAADLGRFWEMFEVLFSRQHHLENDDLIRYAEELGVDDSVSEAALRDIPHHPPTKEPAVANCTHLDTIIDVTPSDDGCHDCLQTGDQWVHLRLCQACGHVGCCDSSPNRHATAHAKATPHPVVRSFEPGEDWYFCYPDDLLFELRGARPAPSHGVDQR